MAGSESGSGRLWDVLQLVQRRLKPDAVRVALRAVSDPVAHQAMQVTRAHATPGGHVRGPHAPVFALDFMKRCDHDVVEARPGESLQETTLEHVDATLGCDRAGWLSDEITTRETTADHRVRGSPAEEVCDAWTEPDANQQGLGREASLVRPDQRTAQNPFRCLPVLQLNGDGRAAVRDDANRRVWLCRDHPAAADKRAKRVVRFVERDLRAIDESAADAHLRTRAARAKRAWSLC